MEVVVKVQEAVADGGKCATSDECLEGSWCRSGDHRCWTEDDCLWHSHVSQVAAGPHDCERLPRTKKYTTWDALCAGSMGDEFPCQAVMAVRVLVAVSATLALVTCVLVCCAPKLAGLVGSIAFCLGLTAILMAATFHIPDAHANGPGFVLLVVGAALAFLGSLVALRSGFRTGTDALPEAERLTPRKSGEEGGGFAVCMESLRVATRTPDSEVVDTVAPAVVGAASGCAATAPGPATTGLAADGAPVPHVEIPMQDTDNSHV